MSATRPLVDRMTPTMGVPGELGKPFPQACGQLGPVDNFVHPQELLRPVRVDGRPRGRPPGRHHPSTPGGHAERPAAPARKRGRRAFPWSAERRDAARRRRQLAAGAGLDEAEEPEPDDVEVVDEEDGVEEVDDDPAPTELLEEERLSVR